MKKIPLTQGRFALVDDEDYDFLMQWKWHFNCGYAIRTESIDGKPKKYRMHREIMRPGKGVQVDHIDHDGLNNKRKNLRNATHTQNRRNTPTYKNSTSGYKGVSWYAKLQKWAAQINIKGKRKRIGYFDTKESAARKYNEAAKEEYGEFAYLNRIES